MNLRCDSISFLGGRVGQGSVEDFLGWGRPVHTFCSEQNGACISDLRCLCVCISKCICNFGELLYQFMQYYEAHSRP